MSGQSLSLFILVHLKEGNPQVQPEFMPWLVLWFLLVVCTLVSSESHFVLSVACGYEQKGKSARISSREWQLSLLVDW